MTIPICAVTGRIAGDADACGDCDPCSAAHVVPDVVKRLLAEKEEWRQKYADAAAAADEMTTWACGWSEEFSRCLRYGCKNPGPCTGFETKLSGPRS